MIRKRTIFLRALCLLIALLLTVLLSACGSKDEQTAEPGPTQVPAGIPQATPVPTAAPTATPFPRVDPADYVLIWKNNTRIGMNYMVPTHWTESQVGERYSVFYEPVPDGETGFRVSFANKRKYKDPDSNTMRSELRKLLTSMSEVYTDFQHDDAISRDLSLVRFKGYSTYYTYTDEYGVTIKGFVIIATYNRRIYCMNFSGPEERFTEMMTVGKKILDSVSRVSSS
ncbi:MAG: hypothetical protein Q4B19_01620 [Clostridia bacterium]|nr:hypothetical protein [Clostridia bacterium]